MRFVYLALLNLSLLSALSACGRHGPRNADAPIPEATPPTHPKIVGPLAHAALELQHNEWAESCDIQVREHQAELTEALDEKAEAINAFDLNHPDSNYKYITVGPTYFSVPTNSEIADKQWHETPLRSWEEMYSDYLEIKDSPIDKRWQRLNGRARSRLADDESRIVYGRNFYINKDILPVIEPAIKEVHQCSNDESCDGSTIKKHVSEAVFKLLQDNVYFNFYLSRILDTQTPHEKQREYIQKLARRIQFDLESLSFVPETSLTRTSAHTLLLPLNVDALTSGQSTFAEIIEKIWSSEQLKIKFNWSTASNIYALILHPEAGGRAFVTRNTKLVHLYPGTELLGLAHEFGHILGFPDTYFTVWDYKTCRYTLQQNSEDIMSDVDTGEITPSMWSKLNEVYPAPKDASTTTPPLPGSTSSSGPTQP